ncbi:MAG: FMN-binding glutamate synthase family protein [Cryobacterium sp.]|nr:FMN-binding glutamate synthase family protein [Oligoflexia bacterium]
MRKFFICSAVTILVLIGISSFFEPRILWTLVFFGPLILLGVQDMRQTRHAIRRNFPLLGHGRYFLEMLRPEINQYFVESNIDGRPFNRNKRSMIYQRAKGEVDTLPFGTQLNVYEEGYEWINHSIVPKTPSREVPRVLIGGPLCKKPYSASLFNISAMSYGSLSKNAVLALNEGARLGGFYHNTGEGGLSSYHLEKGGDICWQIGTGYFGCRDEKGSFSSEKFKERAHLGQVKLIEIKLSQGAKPGHGGILPAGKVTLEISKIRGVPMGEDVISPPAHSAFSTPIELLQFVQRLRELSGGKPVGFKLCLGKKREFMAICKAMIETKILPDFITVDGAEGGTGAAPQEFSDSVGTPLNEALIYIHNCLVGLGLRQDIRIIVSGKISTGFNIAQKLALGADLCNAARGMMFAIGCIQALRCNTNECPTGVATQNPDLVKGLVVGDKAPRVARYHKTTLHSFLDVLGAAGLSEPSELRPWHIQRRVDSVTVKHYGEIYRYAEPNSILNGEIASEYSRAWSAAAADSFTSKNS